MVGEVASRRAIFQGTKKPQERELLRFENLLGKPIDDDGQDQGGQPIREAQCLAGTGSSS